MSLYKRNNVYYYDFTINGKRYNRSTGSSNKRDVFGNYEFHSLAARRYIAS